MHAMGKFPYSFMAKGKLQIEVVFAELKFYQLTLRLACSGLIKCTIALDN